MYWCKLWLLCIIIMTRERITFEQFINKVFADDEVLRVLCLRNKIPAVEFINSMNNRVQLVQEMELPPEQRITHSNLKQHLMALPIPSSTTRTQVSKTKIQSPIEESMQLQGTSGHIGHICKSCKKYKYLTHAEDEKSMATHCTKCASGDPNLKDTDVMLTERLAKRREEVKEKRKRMREESYQSMSGPQDVEEELIYDARSEQDPNTELIKLRKQRLIELEKRNKYERNLFSAIPLLLSESRRHDDNMILVKKQLDHLEEMIIPMN